MIMIIMISIISISNNNVVLGIEAGLYVGIGGAFAV
jgi:sRNA-binding carbon storage regulator CsrA